MPSGTSALLYYFVFLLDITTFSDLRSWVSARYAAAVKRFGRQLMEKQQDAACMQRSPVDSSSSAMASGAVPTGIFSLPEDVLHHILSKVAAQDPPSLAAATCAHRFFLQLRASPGSNLWKEAFYGGPQPIRNVAEESALEAAVLKLEDTSPWSRLAAHSVTVCD